MKRRKFNTLISYGTILQASGIHFMKYKQAAKQHALKSGDTIGLVCPSGRITTEKYQKAVKNMELLGLKIKHSKQILAFEGYLAGSDAQRLSDLHSMYLDDEVDAIWCIRGGYGATRLLDDLDFDLIRQHPKLIIGYSDITALINTIYQKTASPCVHGPVAASTFSDYTVKHLQPLFYPDQPHVISLSEKNTQLAEEKQVYKYEVINSGKATGELAGGNLSLIAALMGTAHQIETKGKLVFIEDIGEEPYRVDRMLTQLLSANFFDEAAGVVLGVFAGCHRKDELSNTLHHVVKDRLSKLEIPAVYGFSFGHINDQCTFPIGRVATLDTEMAEVRLS